MAMKKYGMMLRSLGSNGYSWPMVPMGVDANHFNRGYRGIVRRLLIGYIAATVMLVLHLQAYSQTSWGHTFLLVKCRREGTYRWGHDDCWGCTQGSFSLDAAFDGADCRCLPTFPVIDYPGGTEDWLYRGRHIARTQGTAYLDLYFLLYDREDAIYDGWDPVASLGAPDRVTLVISGTAYAEAARNVIADGCSMVSLQESALDQSLSVEVQACSPSPGEWKRSELDVVHRILPLEWKYLGYDPPELNVNAYVWKAEIAVPFNSYGEWFVPYSTINCNYYYGRAGGSIGIMVCPLLRGLSLHLPTYRKGANNRPEPNPYGEGDIGVDVEVRGSYACISSRELYVANRWGDWSQHTTCEWSFSSALTSPSPRSNEFGCAYEVIHEVPVENRPGQCFQITNLPGEGLPFPATYTLTCTAIDNEDGYRESDTFRMRLHYPIEPVKIVESKKTEPCHGEEVSSVVDGKYTAGPVNICVEMTHSISFTWGISGELSIPAKLVLAKLVLGGTVTGNYSQEVVRSARSNTCFQVEQPRKDMQYVIMAAPRAVVEVWECDVYDRSGYLGQTTICRWKPPWSDRFPDGTVMDGRPSDLIVGLVIFPRDIELHEWLEDNCPWLPCRPGQQR
jgi:hypothetical protein